MEVVVDVSIFLSKALGLYLLIVGSGMLINPRIRSIFLDIMKNHTLLYMSDFMGLVMGILIVTSHNIWVFDWRLIITLIGWLTLVKGTLRVVFPHLGNPLFIKWMSCNAAYYTTVIVMILAGATIYYTGCVHSQPSLPF
jgi:hypothetical protein